LYADSKKGEPSARQPTHRGDPLSGIVGGFSYSGQVPSYRPASDYTARMIPVFPEVSVPLGAANILWQN
jgi:starch phosphorylase